MRILSTAPMYTSFHAKAAGEMRSNSSPRQAKAARRKGSHRYRDETDAQKVRKCRSGLARDPTLRTGVFRGQNRPYKSRFMNRRKHPSGYAQLPSMCSCVDNDALLRWRADGLCRRHDELSKCVRAGRCSRRGRGHPIVLVDPRRRCQQNPAPLVHHPRDQLRQRLRFRRGFAKCWRAHHRADA